MRRGPEKYGKSNPLEREIVEEIIFHRQQGQTYQGICDDLNAKGKWPRKAPRWMPMMVFHIWKKNRRDAGAIKIEDIQR